MALSSRSLKLRKILKEQIQKKDFTYRSVAENLGVSIPTVKRWMTKDDIPFEMLDALLIHLDLNWAETMEKLSENRAHRSPISGKQEAFIAKHPKLAYVFLCFFRGLSFDETATHLKLSENELEKFCYQMDRANLIVYDGKKNVRPVIRGPFKFKPAGAFSKKYYLQCLRRIFQMAIDQNMGFSGEVPTRDTWISAFETYMSKKSFIEMRLEFYKLQERFRAVAQSESKFLRPDELIPVTQMQFHSELNLWREVLWESHSG